MDKVASLNQLFDQWKDEHRELDAYVRELTNWTNQESQLSVPRFLEAVTRLREFRDRLSAHFDKETELGNLLAKSRPGSSREIEGVRRQAAKDHSHLTKRLEALIGRMENAEAEFDSWSAAVYEFNLLIDVLEQHEEQEAESLGWLLPRQQTR